MNNSVLVIGGGIAGMTSALSIARQGFGVFLVEREPELGGNLRHIYTGTFSSDDPQALLHETIAAVTSEQRITVLTETEVVHLSGYRGQGEVHARVVYQIAQISYLYQRTLNLLKFSTTLNELYKRHSLYFLFMVQM